jgi:hypothetical protein
MARFITTPTREWLAHGLRECSFRFLVASPYVGTYLPAAVAKLSAKVSTTLLTRTDLWDFAVGASDIEAVCMMARRGGKILSMAGLHAKVYVVDNRCALVTSANATKSGMECNWECGVAIDDPSEIAELLKLILRGFGSSQRPQSWTLDEVEMLRAPVQALREQLAPMEALRRLELRSAPPIKLNGVSQAALLNGFSGWTNLVLEGTLAQANGDFTLDSLLSTCMLLVAARFPRNRYVREQVRKQLQRLRDLGLIEFIGGGNYRRTVHR